MSYLSLAFCMILIGQHPTLSCEPPVHTKEPQQVEFRIPGKPTAAAFSPDGRLLFCASEVRELDLELGLPRLSHLGAWNAATGEQVASCNTESARVIDQLYPSNDPTVIRIGTQRNTIAAVSLKDGHWKNGYMPRDRRFVLALGETQFLTATPFHVIEVRGANTQVQSEYRGHQAQIRTLLPVQDGRRLVSVGEDAVKLWDLEKQEFVRDVATGIDGREFGLSANGKYCAYRQQQDALVLAEMESGKVLFGPHDIQHPGIRRVQVSGDGRFIAYQRHSKALWLMDTKAKDPAPERIGVGVAVFAFAHQGASYAMITTDGKVTISCLQEMP